MKKVLFIVSFISVIAEVKSQYIIAGQYTSSDYFHDVVPDSNFCAYGSSLGAMVTKSIDINSDGNMDFNIIAYRGPGLGNPGSSIYVSTVGNSEIVSSGPSTCTYSVSATPCCGTVTSIVAKAFVYGDTIKSSLNWLNGTLQLNNCYYCCVGEFEQVNPKYIGTRIFVGSEILFGYIKVTLYPGCLGFTLYEYACNKACANLPAINITSSSDSICSGETATLTVSGASSYSWSAGSTNSVVAVSPSSTSIYSVTGTYSNSCVATETVALKVNACVGIKESAKENSIEIYPNPTDDYLNFELSDHKNISEIEMTNTLGQTVLKQPYSKQVDVSSLNTGCYFINLISEDGPILHSKFLKE